MGKQGQHISPVLGNRNPHRGRLLCLLKNPFQQAGIRHFLKMILHRIGIGLHIKPAEQIFELQPLEIVVGFLCVRIAEPGLLQIKTDLSPGIDGGQRLAHARLVPVLLQILAGPGGLNLRRMGIGIFNGAVFLDDLGGGLFPHPRHPRDIIRSVSHERLHVNKFRGSHSVSFLHIRGIVIRHLGSALLCPGNPDLHMLRGKLQCIPVSGNDGHLHPLFLAGSGNGPQQVVRLQPGLLHDLDLHSLQHFLDHRNLLPQFFRHGLSRPFVVRVHLMPKGWRVDVKGDRQIFRFFLVQDLEQDIQKPEDGVGVQPFRVGQVRHPVKCPVQNTVSVNQNNFFVHRSFSFYHKFHIFFQIIQDSIH